MALALITGILSSAVRAEIPAGTWARRAIKDGTRVVMTVESTGKGRIVTYRNERRDGSVRTIVVETELDGKENKVTVDGKPSVQTMAFRRLDERRTVNTVRVDGKLVNTQNLELAPDGKLLTVETVPVNAVNNKGFTDYWDKQ